MKRIEIKIFGHDAVTDITHPGLRIYSNKEVRESEPLEVMTYRDLVKRIAYISHFNPNFSLFFRGQSEEYPDRYGVSSIYPSIYRNERGQNRLRKIVRERRFKKLEDCKNMLLSRFDYRGKLKLHHHEQLTWGILQHYCVCSTPLLDVTQSLRAACSFALNNNRGKYGYIYVLGLPHVNGSISFYVEEELLNLKLLTICPPTALRPFFQEGYLVGDFPTKSVKRKELNFTRRLIAKFKIKKVGFWDRYFKNIPDEALNPSDDKIKELCDSIKADADQEIEDG